jgi:hypothetical protein
MSAFGVKRTSRKPMKLSASEIGQPILLSCTSLLSLIHMVQCGPRPEGEDREAT